MKTLLKYWDSFWFSRFDPTSVALFRISLGLLIFFMFICNFFNWERFYDANGVFSLNDADLNLKRGTDNGWWSVFYWTEGKLPVRFWWWVGLISSFTFTIGFQTRLSTIILYLLQSSMIHRNLLITNGDDLVFRMVLFYSCFAPLGYSLSVDNVLRDKFFKNKKPGELPLIWPIRAMQINVLLIYVVSLPYKLLLDFSWINGEAMYYVSACTTWGRFPFPQTFYMWDGLVSKITTYGTVFVEGTFPILIWFSQTKLIVIALISLLHIGIAITIPNVIFFTLSMVCAFFIFVPGDLSRKLVTKLTKSN